MLRVTFLGTSSARPTVSRNTSALAVQRGSDLLLFDCGEGTQRQMLRYGSGFSVKEIYVTHMHADHYLGTFGLLRTMGLQGRESEIRIFAPADGVRLLEQVIALEVDELPFPVEIRGLAPSESVRHEGYEIVAFSVDHRGPSLGYALKEFERPGQFFPERARELGVPEGPLFGRLQRGHAICLDDGSEVRSEDVMGPARAGRSLVYTGDTRPCDGTIEAARGCDLLIHEATFSEEELERAARTGHSTAGEAAEVAAAAGAQRLVLTHLSARYSERPHVLEREARRKCPDSCEVVVAYDGLSVEVSLSDD